MTDNNTKEISKDFALEEIIGNVIAIPGVRVNRKEFLTKTFASEDVGLQELLEGGPVEAGISRESIEAIANKLIIKRTSQSSIASFVAGIPGGLAMAATIPADIMQFFGVALKLAQEIGYLFGAQDLWVDGQVDDERVKNQLILYCGVMFGVSGAVSGVRVLSAQIAKTTLKKLPQKALTKTFWYPIVKQIGKAIGVRVTKSTVAKGLSKVIPIIGGVISGTLNFASMMPMAKRLYETFYKATFDYSEEEFEQDVEVINRMSEGEIIMDEKKSKLKELAEKVSDDAKAAIDNVGGLLGKFDKKKTTDEEADKFEEIKKYKELLDMGIITQEEFEKKKEELLGI